ncbi:MAG: hypothetical protein AMXMBFR82_01540 [Candidatus Hydrogenedentota bacterium]
MERLIWFSFPGVFIVAAYILTGKPEVATISNAILGTIAVPTVGFVWHQTFRLAFETWFGFASRHRDVIRSIKEFWKNYNITDHEAFLIWECTFYGNSFPQAFQEHDRRAWHYTIACWSAGSAAFIAFIYVTLKWYLGFSEVAIIAPRISIIHIALVYIFIAFALVLKGYLTWRSICAQEVQVFWHHLKELEKCGALVRNWDAPAPCCMIRILDTPLEDSFTKLWKKIRGTGKNVN